VEAPAKLVPGAGRSRVRRKKGRIIQAYTQPVSGRRVICLDELGPVSAKTYPGEVWTCGPGRATFTPDDGRRGSVWVLGACEPATGLATTLCSPQRDSASFIQVLEQVLQTYPAREWVLIADNLSTHLSRETQTALIAWPEVTVLFLPKYACWLNLIEPWWQPRRSLALKGRRFEAVDAIIEAVVQGTAYGNQHRYPYVWKKTI
jgi:DDE superfamily endonuclease